MLNPEENISKENSPIEALYTPGPNAIDVTIDQDKGVLKEILKEGTENEGPLFGDTVSVHYVGTLAEDGTQFDSSRDRGEQFTFKLGKGEVIKAWDLGVTTMKKGEICRLTCQSNYAYGETGSPPKIPPFACLVFEIELFDWCGEDLSSKKDKGIVRRIIQPGEGHSTPNDEALVDVKIIGKVNGKVFDERELKFTLGEGTEHNIPEGIERALKKFQKNERSTIKLTPKYCFGSAGNEELGVPGTADVYYEVHLKDFEKVKEIWQMDPQERLEQSIVCKEKGTLFFKQNKYRVAIRQYKKILKLLQYDSRLNEEQKAERKNVLLAGNLNLSMCHLKINDHLPAKKYAVEALELDPNNVKAYFRKGQALLGLGEAIESQNCFKKVLELEPSNKAAQHQLQECLKLIKTQKEKEKKLYSGMFDKFAKSDAKKLPGVMDVMSGDLGVWYNSQNSERESDSCSEGDDLKDIQFIEPYF